MDELLSDFLAETSENLETVDGELVRFEAEPNDLATLNNIFRLVHTIKGTCGFLGLPRLEGIAHAGETLLGRFRDRAIPVTPERVNLVLACVDRIKIVLAGIAETGGEPEGDDGDLIARLLAAATDNAPKRGPNGEQWDPDLRRFLHPGEQSLADVEAAFQATKAETPQARPQRSETSVDAQTIRVSIDAIENLMSAVSELVLARNALIQRARALDDREIKTPLLRLSAVTAELQHRVMKTRMQPVGLAWRTLPRLVRNLGQELGKDVSLKLQGENVELDRQVLEQIRDPITHMVRNAIDHGIETKEARREAGKSETGSIRLSASHEGGHVVIAIKDDGAGLDAKRIRAKAIEKGLVSANDAARLSDADIHRFIFTPGFSTASAITTVSGRGVGMDVVRANIEKIGGTVELATSLGKGTTIRVRIPLTLAIVPALILTARGHRYAVPQSGIVELVRAGEGLPHKIEAVHGARVLRLRDQLLPLLDLGDALKLDMPNPFKTSVVLVMQADNRRYGLIVDDVQDTEEIVVKPLAATLRGIGPLSGAAILGDGGVALILDPRGLADALGAPRVETKAGEVTPIDTAAKTQNLILFLVGGALKAAPMDLVARLEDVECARIERVDGRAVLRYRNTLMPVLHPNGLNALNKGGRQPMLVFALPGGAFGLAVDRIVDVAKEHVSIDLTSTSPGVLGLATIRGKAVEMIDVRHFLNASDGGGARRSAA